jgi:bacteriorhodopsin
METDQKEVHSLGSLKRSFFTSYLILMGYTLVTLVEALRTPIVNVRNIMNIETTVSITAGFVYKVFNDMIDSGKFDLNKINELRYVDWSITTPLILLAIILFYNPESPVSYVYYLAIVILNWGMLLLGYLGEVGTVSKLTGCLGGFAFFAALLVLLYSCCIDSKANHIVFYIFAIIWTGYGINYMVKDDEIKNITYNTLDVISKALFGIGLWLFYGKVLKFT